MSRDIKNSILRQLKDEESLVFFSNIRFNRQKRRLKERLEYSWKDRDYKIYPSSLYIGMCPYKFIQEEVHKYLDLGENIAYRAEVGKYLHLMYQNESVGIEDFLYKTPKVPKTLKKKLKDNWPEVPIYDPDLALSGRADLVLNIKNEPVLIDIKTTSQDPYMWDKYSPPVKYKTQIFIYAYYMNKFKYYDKIIKRVGLAVVNITMPPGSEGSEKEFYYDITDNDMKEIETLLKEVKKEKENFLGNITSFCTYTSCKAHGKQISI